MDAIKWLSCIFVAVLALSQSITASSWREYETKGAESSHPDTANYYYSLALDLASQDPQCPDTTLTHLFTALARTYAIKGDYAAADSLLRLGIAAWGDNRPSASLIQAYQRVGTVSRRMGKLYEAIQFTSDALRYRRDFVDSTDLAYAKLEFDLGVMYSDLLVFDSALNIYGRALALAEHIQGSNGKIVVKMRGGIAVAKLNAGLLAEAASDFVQNISFWQQHAGSAEDSVQWAFELVNLSITRRNQGMYAEAFNLNKDAISIYQTSKSDYDQELAKWYCDLGMVLNDLGLNDDAVMYIDSGLSMADSTIGKGTVTTAQIRADFAYILNEMGEYERAAQEASLSYSASDSLLPPGHMNTLVALGNYGIAMWKMNRKELADSIFGEYIRLAELSGSWNNRNVANGHLFKSQVLLDMQLPSEALAHADEAIKIDSSTKSGYGDLLPDALTVRSLALIDLGRIDEALESALSAWRLQHKEYVDNVILLPESWALSAAAGLQRSKDVVLSLAHSFPRAAEQFQSEIGTVILSTKTLVLDELVRRQQFANEDLPDSVGSLVTKLRIIRTEIAIYSQMENFAAVDSLGQVQLDLERRIALSSSAFWPKDRSRTIDPQQILAALQEQEILVEYCSFIDVLDTANASEYFARLVISYDSAVRVEVLAPADNVDILADSLADAMRTIAESSRFPTLADKQTFLSIGEPLFDYCFAGLGDQLLGSSNVLIATDGSLGMVPFHALPTNDGNYLIEETLVSYVSTGRDILKEGTAQGYSNQYLLVGDPDFLASASHRDSILESDSFNQVSQLASRQALAVAEGDCLRLSEAKWSRLPYTADEIAQVKHRLDEHFDGFTETLLDSAASETNLTLSAPGKRFIHIATHGFFVPERCIDGLHKDKSKHITDNDPRLGLNPLLLSGIVLAGASNPDSFGKGEGLFTALELANIDLSQTELLVLSGCETAMGIDMEGEGVYGLRRTAIQAGAKTVISSLWPVDDATTASMMDAIYDSDDRSPSQRLRDAQLSLLQTYRENDISDHPFAWAPFIAIESGRP